jgi:hypothetical protein
VSEATGQTVKWQFYWRTHARAHLLQARAYEMEAEAEAVSPMHADAAARDARIDHYLSLAEDYRSMAADATRHADEWDRMEREDTEIRRAG